MQKTIKVNKLFTFFIDPCPKPRMTRSDRWKQRPAVLRYFQFKDMIKFLARRDGFTPGDKLFIQYYVEMPKSWSKKKRMEMNGTPHQVRPDTDNFTKAIKDALLTEDSSVYVEYAEKYWGDTGKILIGNIS